MVSKEGPPPNMKVENLNFDHKETLFETRAAASEWLKFKSILVSYIGNAYRIFQTLISFDQKKEKKRFDLQFHYFLFSSSPSSLKTLEKKFKMALAGATSIAFYSRFKGRPLALWTSTFNC